MLAEVDEDAELQATGVKVVEHLGAMLVARRRDGLEFHEDLVIDDEVGVVCLP